MKTIFAKHDQKGHDAHQYSALKSAIGTRALINLLDLFCLGHDLGATAFERLVALLYFLISTGLTGSTMTASGRQFDRDCPFRFGLV
jgi:hypothetical protein